MQNDRPQYAVDAVDKVLILLLTLWRDGHIRVSEAAAVLGVARSTAHRLLRMLVYHGFAVQRDDRVYVPGPALARNVPRTDYVFLRTWLRPAMEQANRNLDETVQLVVRDGTEVLFLDAVEARQLLRVGPRTGVRLPAEITSGGRILLAQLTPVALAELYARRPDVDLPRLQRALMRTRRQRFGLNVEETERGIAAVGVCVPDQGSGQPSRPSASRCRPCGFDGRRHRASPTSCTPRCTERLPAGRPPTTITDRRPARARWGQFSMKLSRLG